MLPRRPQSRTRLPGIATYPPAPAAYRPTYLPADLAPYQPCVPYTPPDIPSCRVEGRGATGNRSASAKPRNHHMYCMYSLYCVYCMYVLYVLYAWIAMKRCTCTCACTNTCRGACTFTCVYVCVYRKSCACSCACTYTRTYACIERDAHVQAHVDMYVCMCESRTYLLTYLPSWLPTNLVHHTPLLDILSSLPCLPTSPRPTYLSNDLAACRPVGLPAYLPDRTTCSPALYL